MSLSRIASSLGLLIGFNVVCWSLIGPVVGQEKKPTAPESKKAPEAKKEAEGKKAPPVPSVPITEANVHYGPHERQVLDFWKAKSDTPTPLVLCIHGGGWTNGDKSGYYSGVKAFLDSGISVVSMNYRLIKKGSDDNIVPPVKAPLDDAARALQFIRSKAKEWNIDKTRIGATGGSAGGCSSLWLAFHADMANPNSDDPVARESTRLYCAAVNGAQVSLNIPEVKEWLPNYTYGGHAFGITSNDDWTTKKDQLDAWLKEYSPILLVSSDDPPIGLYYKGVEGAKVGEVHPDPTHSPILGIKLEEKLKELGVKVVFHSNTSPNKELPDTTKFLIHYLKQ